MNIELFSLVLVVSFHTMILTIVVNTADPTTFQVNRTHGDGCSLGNYSNHPFTLECLGEVEGKFYFVEYSRLNNWRGAKAYCETANLTLASIDTENQLQFLNQTLRKYPFYFYWTSSHESRQASMMEWDGTGRSPDPAILTDWTWERPAYQYCGLFHLINASNSRMMGYRCDYTERLLCQDNAIGTK